jgi:hypothetical protein
MGFDQREYHVREAFSSAREPLERIGLVGFDSHRVNEESGTDLSRPLKNLLFPVYTFRPQFPHYMAKAIDSSTSN